MPFQFEWDPAKAIANFAKHGVTFWEGTEAFYDADRAEGSESLAHDAQRGASNKTIKKARPSPKRTAQAEPMPEVDFSKGVRGKYVERYRAARVTVRSYGLDAEN